MEIIGERINGIFKDIQRAIAEKDKKPVQDWAIKQSNNGAYWLDVSAGVSAENPMDAMIWLVDTIQEVVNTPLAIDTTDYDIMEEAVKRCKVPPLLNSTHADRYKIERVFPMAAKYNARLIGLCMSEESGVPKSADERVMLAAEMLAACDEFGVAYEDLYIDPLILPVNVAQDHVIESLETLRTIKGLSDPAPKTTVGLSNISQRCANRPLLNRTMLAMLMAAGLDSAIADANDDLLMQTAAAGRVLMNQEIYADSFVQLYMAPKH